MFEFVSVLVVVVFGFTVCLGLGGCFMFLLGGVFCVFALSVFPFFVLEFVSVLVAPVLGFGFASFLRAMFNSWWVRFLYLRCSCSRSLFSI